MIRKVSRSQRRSQWKLFLGVLCVALVLLGSTIQVAHTHPDGDLSHAGCSLCATAHVVAQVAGQPVPVAPVLVIAAPQTLVSLPLPVALTTFALFTRPPPAVSTLA